MTKGRWEWGYTMDIPQKILEEYGAGCLCGSIREDALLNDKGEVVFFTDGYWGTGNIYISEDNKRLIAAAPEMLELLEECKDSFEILNEEFPQYTLIERKFEDVKSLLSKIKGGKE